jgi:hypothetical protein
MTKFKLESLTLINAALVKSVEVRHQHSFSVMTVTYHEGGRMVMYKSRADIEKQLNYINGSWWNNLPLWKKPFKFFSKAPYPSNQG